MISKSSIVLSIAATFLLAAPLLAGGKKHGYTCEAEVSQCLSKMASKFANRGWVGIEYDHDKDAGTLTVERVVPDSPAYKADLREDDVIVAVNGVPLATKDEAVLKKATADWSPGSTVTYTVRRGTTKLPVYVTLGKFPKDVKAQWIGNHVLEHHMPTQIAQH